jgi:hypothetical protein
MTITKEAKNTIRIQSAVSNGVTSAPANHFAAFVSFVVGIIRLVPTGCWLDRERFAHNRTNRYHRLRNQPSMPDDRRSPHEMKKGLVCQSVVVAAMDNR